MRQSYSKPKVGRFLRHGVVVFHPQDEPVLPSSPSMSSILFIPFPSCPSLSFPFRPFPFLPSRSHFLPFLASLHPLYSLLIHTPLLPFPLLSSRPIPFTCLLFLSSSEYTYKSHVYVKALRSSSLLETSSTFDIPLCIKTLA